MPLFIVNNMEGRVIAGYQRKADAKGKRRKLIDFLKTLMSELF
jgi:hypothetical protein